MIIGQQMKSKIKEDISVFYLGTTVGNCIQAAEEEYGITVRDNAGYLLSVDGDYRSVTHQELADEFEVIRDQDGKILTGPLAGGGFFGIIRRSYFEESLKDIKLGD